MDSFERSYIDSYLDESAIATRTFADADAGKQIVAAFADVVATALANGHKLMIAGNGGSAADAQHIAAEIVGRYAYDRPALPALALTVDTSILTAVGNDYGYVDVFSRQVLALGQSGDVFLGISTSGKSPNIVEALKSARTKGVVTLGFVGAAEGPMDSLCDHILHAPSFTTAVVQQIHITAAHLICGLVECRLYPRG